MSKKKNKKILITGWIDITIPDAPKLKPSHSPKLEALLKEKKKKGKKK